MTNVFIMTLNANIKRVLYYMSILKFRLVLFLMSFTTEKTGLLNFRLCVHMTKLKELVMGRHQEVCNASSQHEVPSK